MAGFTPVLMSSNGNSSIINIDLTAQPFWQTTPGYKLGLICTVSNGASLTYNVQVTADPIPSNSSNNWNNHDILVSQTASANSNIDYPVTGIRLNVTGYVSGSVNLGVAKWP